MFFGYSICFIICQCKYLVNATTDENLGFLTERDWLESGDEENSKCVAVFFAGDPYEPNHYPDHQGSCHIL